MTRAAILLLAGVTLAACGSTGRGDPSPSPDPDEAPTTTPAPTAPTAPLRDPAPWSAAPLPADRVPAPYLDAWRDAENRGECALLAFPDPPPGPDAVTATPRTARFGGGWGVAYDLPGLRSAFGVAGTGVEPGPDTYDDWPHHREWRDGSRAGYGPEGGRGPKRLAYLRVAGERCLYNVWSNLGRTHLEALLESLRRVDLSTVSAATYSPPGDEPERGTTPR